MSFIGPPDRYQAHLFPLRLSVLCGKSAYISLAFVGPTPIPSFQFVGYKQKEPAPSHARNLSLLHSQITLPTPRIELNIVAVPFGPPQTSEWQSHQTRLQLQAGARTW